MVEQSQSWSTEYQIASVTENAGQIVDDVLARMRQFGWEERDVFAVHLALEEALVNAIKHGNQRDAGKSVDVAVRITEQRVEVSVADEGRGFDPNAVPDPTDDDNLELPSGRGLMLMRMYMTSVEFNDTGNRVVMTKCRSHAAAEVDDG